MLDLGQVLAQPVSNLDTIVSLSINDLEDDPRNFYQLTRLDDLAANIELLGLQAPIRVRRHPDKDGKYIIVSGHRRRAAIRKLVEDGKTEWEQIPCIIEQDAGSPALQELRLIYANSDTRKLTSSEVGKQVERVEELLYQLKEEGMDFPGKMREHVARACKISESKLARLKVIAENLYPGFKAEYDSGKIVESAAYSMARMPYEFQRRLSAALIQKDFPTAENLTRIGEKYKAGWTWEPQLTCPDGTPCHHGDAFLRHDSECSYTVDMCGGTICCMNCPRLNASFNPCERACSKAKAAKKAERDKKKSVEEEERAAQRRECEQGMTDMAVRLLRAADVAGLTKKQDAVKTRYLTYTVQDLRHFAEGNFCGREYYRTELEPEQINVPVTAKLLHCSADYIVGLKDEIEIHPDGTQSAPAPQGDGWHDGNEKPKPDMEVFVIDAMPPYMSFGAIWDGHMWRQPSGKAMEWLQPWKWTYKPELPKEEEFDEYD